MYKFHSILILTIDKLHNGFNKTIESLSLSPNLEGYNKVNSLHKNLVIIGLFT